MNDFGVMEYFSFSDFFIIYKISLKKIKKNVTKHVQIVLFPCLNKQYIVMQKNFVLFLSTFY